MQDVGLSGPVNIISWICRLVAAVILAQTLYFKFTGAPESVYIFTTVGMEPWGRIGSGVVELLAAICLLIPATVWLGALLALGTICGALFFHLTKLGLEVQGDRGLLFALAIIVLVTSATLIWLHRAAMPLLNRWTA
jgi:putative oxidoreductase